MTSSPHHFVPISEKCILKTRIHDKRVSNTEMLLYCWMRASAQFENLNGHLRHVLGCVYSNIFWLEVWFWNRVSWLQNLINGSHKFKHCFETQFWNAQKGAIQNRVTRVKLLVPPHTFWYCCVAICCKVRYVCILLCISYTHRLLNSTEIMQWISSESERLTDVEHTCWNKT